MSQFGNLPSAVLVGAVEKLVAKMDEADIASAFARELPLMPQPVFGAFVEATFDAFRDRGESSEDAAEGAGTTIERIGRRDPDAVAALMAYARANSGVLKEAVAHFVEAHPDDAGALPLELRAALSARLAHAH